MVRAPISAMPRTVKTAFRMLVSIERAPLKTIATSLFAVRANYSNSKALEPTGSAPLIRP
jgi:hypothetical protein